MSGDSGKTGHAHRRWRISGKKNHVDSVKNDINVTPLVDVMLVLLIIFMLMTLVMGRGHDVKLPQAKNFSEEKDKNQPVVTIACSDESCATVDLYVEKNKLGPVTPAVLKEMDDRVNAHWKSPLTVQAGGAGRIFFKASNNVTYDKVYPVLEYMNKTMAISQVDIAIAKGGEK
jgi:biopolymer transport protein ExbD